MKLCYVLLAIALLLPGAVPVSAQVGNQMSLNPKNIPQFVDPMPHFAGARIKIDANTPLLPAIPGTPGTPARAALTISMEDHVGGNPIMQQALSTGTTLTDPAGVPFLVSATTGLTRVWGYRITQGGTSHGPSWPAYSLEVQKGIPLQVTYLNNITGQYSDVGLIADQTIHWAAPTGMEHMGETTPYEGPVPGVAHLHGVEVPSAFDGGPDSWFTHTGVQGTGYVTNTYVYPNSQEAATLWFHDHALGATRLNVYTGLAGFYFLKGADEENVKLPGWTGDNTVAELDLLGVATGRTYRPLDSSLLGSGISWGRDHGQREDVAISERGAPAVPVSLLERFQCTRV
jgi:FtsP/CotA-like multicopper oxidase with cupredoxin domain